MSSPRSASRVVENIYAQFSGEPIAFLDEAFRGFERPGEAPFYILTAVVVDQSDMVTMREDLVTIADDTYWHTSEALRSDSGRERAKEMLRYLMDGSEPCVVARKVSIDPGDHTLERARRACLRSLAIRLTSGVPDVTSPVPVLLMEQRNTHELRNNDRRTYKELISDGLVPRTSRLVQASPSDDRLLWLPDVVSSAVRRATAFGDRAMLEIIEDRIHYLPDSDVQGDETT